MSGILTLVVLAAGMGSRYGGLKQIDPMGPGGEPVLAYSVFDAVRAGFDRVVFVIREDFDAEFRSVVGRRFEGRVDVGYVWQRADDLPAGTPVPAPRAKPWGTGHAVLAARKEVRSPFMVINADDFYGSGSFRLIADFLRGAPPQEAAGRGRFAMAGFMLERTLSAHGAVARGVCRVDADGRLAGVEETMKIQRGPDGVIRGVRPGGAPVTLDGRETVSMNCWGFTPVFFLRLEEQMAAFLGERGQDPSAEFHLPAAVAGQIVEGTASVDVMTSPDSWFGVTYREDKPMVQQAISGLVASGAYPERLF